MMEEYKSINDQLIKEVQKLKVTIGAYQKEVLELNRIIMKQHLERVQQSSVERILLNKIKKVKNVWKEMNSTVAFLFNDECDETNRESGNRTNITETRRRTSEEILEEFRRSNVYRPVQPVSSPHRSPLRRSEELESSNKSNQEDQEISTPYTEEDAEGEQEQQSASSSEAVYDMRCRLDDLDEEEEEEQVEDEGEESEEENTSDDEGMSVLQLEISDCSESPTRRVEEILRHKNYNNNGNTIEAARFAENTLEDNQTVAAPISSNNSKECEITVDSTLTPEINFEESEAISFRIAVGQSSTPNTTTNEQQKLYKKKSNHSCNPNFNKPDTNDEYSNDDTEAARTGRPRRRCTPVNFTEVPINAKQRNDGGVVVINPHKNSRNRSNTSRGRDSRH